MSPHEATQTTLIIGFKTLALVLGGLITLLAYRAYRRTNDRALGLFAVGFGIVTFGTLLAGGVHQVLQTDLLVGLLIESALIAVGFLVIVYSLYTTT
jgi:hypothetical protein